jgi:hypothetical protein
MHTYHLQDEFTDADRKFKALFAALFAPAPPQRPPPAAHGACSAPSAAR